ncbi:MAG: hypothetical protein AAGA10_31140, partial [Bacteroidota bacterium]
MNNCISSSLLRSSFILGFLSIILFHLGFSQRPRFYPQTHEIGFRAANVQMAPSINEFRKEGESLQFANGIQYKYHWDLFHVFRLSIGQQANTYQTTDPVSNPDMFRIEVENTNFALGYEGNLPLGAMTLFGGAEGVYSRQSHGLSTVFSGTDETFWEETRDTDTWGANVFGGMRVFFTQHLSTTLEAYGSFLNQDSDSEQFINDLHRQVAQNNWNYGLNLY